MALNEDEQTEAVFKSSRTDIDPVSGNEVPPGSLPEEVRDDIPAMLSEGEYVVPADVLRFYGVKFFEDLRAQAKIGLAEMEANGRIGGEPIEEETGDVGISDEDLLDILYKELQEEQTVGAAKGGVMGFQAGGLNYPAYIKQPDITQFGMAGPDFQGGLEYRTYVNDAGLEITIPFFDGQPMGMIPPGYTLKSDAATATEKAAPQYPQDDGGVGSPEDLDRPERPDYSTYSEEQLNEALAKNSTANSAMTGIALALPGVGLFGKLAAAADRNRIEDAMRAKGMEVPEEDETAAQKIVRGITNLINPDKDKDKDKTPPTSPTPPAPGSNDDDEPNWASATDASSAAKVAAANVSEGVDRGQAAEAAAAGVNAGVSAASAAEAAAAGATSIGSGVASTIEDTGRESQGIAGSSSGPMNKGGLMTNKKKKKK
jgi:hypothetical protein